MLGDVDLVGDDRTAQALGEQQVGAGLDVGPRGGRSRRLPVRGGLDIVVQVAAHLAATALARVQVPATTATGAAHRALVLATPGLDRMGSGVLLDGRDDPDPAGPHAC